MIKRTVEVSGYNIALYLENKQLMVMQDNVLTGQIPAEDIGILIVDAPTTTYSHSVVVELMKQESAIVLCGEEHLPVGQILPCAANSLQAQRIMAQASAPLPVRKRLWRQIIQAKIRNQASALPENCEVQDTLFSLAERVRSDDADGAEASAARLYWRFWLGEEHEFLRRRDGEPPNNFLNYGYMVMRAAIARAIVAAGFSPSLGIKHHNRYDAFCLADDLLEPFRPLVDIIARELFLSGDSELNKETKSELLSLFSNMVTVEGNKVPLFVAFERMTASLEACYTGKAKKLILPEIL